MHLIVVIHYLQDIERWASNLVLSDIMLRLSASIHHSTRSYYMEKEQQMFQTG